jgi:ankyrin repeat protein
VRATLCSQGGDLNAKDKKNMSPLHCACWKGQTEAVEFLLSNGAQIAENDIALKTALHWAVQFCHYETLLCLLRVSYVRGRIKVFGALATFSAESCPVEKV